MQGTNEGVNHHRKTERKKSEGKEVAFSKFNSTNPCAMCCRERGDPCLLGVAQHRNFPSGEAASSAFSGPGSRGAGVLLSEWKSISTLSGSGTGQCCLR